MNGFSPVSTPRAVGDAGAAGRQVSRPEQVEQITVALDAGASKAAVCRTFKVPRSTLLDTLARVGWTPAGKA